MPSTEPAQDPVKPRRTKPAGLSVEGVYLGEKLDDLADEVRALREKAPSPKLLVGAALVLVGMFYASQLYIVGLIATSRGVDVAPAAESAKKVVGAGAAAGSVVAEPAPPYPAPLEEPPAPAPAAPGASEE